MKKHNDEAETKTIRILCKVTNLSSAVASDTTLGLLGINIGNVSRGTSFRNIDRRVR